MQSHLNIEEDWWGRVGGIEPSGVVIIKNALLAESVVCFDVVTDNERELMNSDQMSRFLTSSAWSSMNLRRGSTCSPISSENSRLASSDACSHWTL